MSPGAAAPEASSQSVHQLTHQNVRAIIELERQARASASMGDRVAVFITALSGNIFFVIIHIAAFVGWMVANSWGWVTPAPDPYPFTFLSLVVSLEAILLSSFVLISQGHENRQNERRSRLDLQINLLAEQENTKMLQMLQAVAAKVGAGVDDDADISVLAEAMNPARLAQQIEDAQ